MRPELAGNAEPHGRLQSTDTQPRLDKHPLSLSTAVSEPCYKPSRAAVPIAAAADEAGLCGGSLAVSRMNSQGMAEVRFGRRAIALTLHVVET